MWRNLANASDLGSDNRDVLRVQLPPCRQERKYKTCTVQLDGKMTRMASDHLLTVA